MLRIEIVLFQYTLVDLLWWQTNEGHRVVTSGGMSITKQQTGATQDKLYDQSY